MSSSAHLDGEQQQQHQQQQHQQQQQQQQHNNMTYHPSGGRHQRRRMGGAGGPMLPLLHGPSTAAELFLDSHPDGSRTAPHRSWQHMSGGGTRGAGMYSHPVMPNNGNSGFPNEHGARGAGGWTPGNNHKGLIHQQAGGVRRSLGPRAFNSRGGGGSPSSGSPPTSLGLIRSVTGEAIQFTETNMDWTKLNIFRTRLCDRLTQMHSCHMANRCLFSHDIAWPRRTPFLPRATALTLRYIPVWCPRVPWPPLSGVCDSLGKISWSSSPSSDRSSYDPNYAHSCCIRGDNCPFVHNLEEFLYHPEVYKTRMCCLANDDASVGDENGNCLCPWYFCPFAHYLYELRDVRQARHAWHPPPQIVDNQFVARTQGFDEVELTVIQYVRKSPNGSIDLYLRHPTAGGGGGGGPAGGIGHIGSSTSAIRDLLFGRYLLPPVFRPIIGSSLEHLIASDWHRKIEFDDLLYLLVMASLLNLVLYPVENFYVPALLSLQNAAIEYQLDLGAGSGNHPSTAAAPPRETKELLTLYDKIVSNIGSPSPTENNTTHDLSPGLNSGDTPSKLTASPDTLESFLELLGPEDLLRVVELFTNDAGPSTPPLSGAVAGLSQGQLSERRKSWETPDSQQPPSTTTAPTADSTDSPTATKPDSEAVEGLKGEASTPITDCCSNCARE